MKAVFLSVKPRFARALLRGDKTAEVRRRFPSIPPGTTVVLYSTSPERAVIGTVVLDRYLQVDSDQVWATYRNQIRIDEADLKDYLEGSAVSSILEVSNPVPLPKPIPLSNLRTVIGLEPPQSFRYLEPEQLAAIQREGLALVGA